MKKQFSRTELLIGENGLKKLEASHPEFDSPTSPTKRVGGAVLDKFEKVRRELIPQLSACPFCGSEFDMKIKKTHILVSALVLALGAAVYLNWQFSGTPALLIVSVTCKTQ